MSFYTARAKAIASKGRSMTLRRLLTTTTKTDVSIRGFLTMYSPEQVGIGNIMQGDGTVAILNDEIAAAGWPGPPRARDQMVIDSKTWTVQGSSAVYDGDALIGHTVFVRGG